MRGRGGADRGGGGAVAGPGGGGKFSRARVGPGPPVLAGIRAAFRRLQDKLSAVGDEAHGV